MIDAARIARLWRRLVRGRVPVPAPSAPRPVDRILGSGLFDRRYYELQTGRSFASDEAAVLDYQHQGRVARLSPHPLFEPEWFGPDLPRNRVTSILAYLDAGAPEHGPGPLFDEAAYLDRVPEAADHPGRALGHFLAHVSDDDLLPVPASHHGSAPTWRRAREIAYQSAREYCRFEQLRFGPRRGPWDLKADAAFVATWLERPLPRRDTETPWVTVVMPVRNRAVQVLEAIASVGAQTLVGWELIVVDDGSTDQTGAVLDQAAAADDRIRVLHLPASGVSAARNAGIEAATGEWLAFLDSDNTWVPHFLQVMIAYLEANGLDAGHSVVDSIFEPTSESESVGRYLNLDADLDHLLVRNHIDLNSLVVRTGLGTGVGGFDASLRRWVDHDFAIRIARRTAVPRVSFVGVTYDHSDDSPDRITATESGRWEWIVLAKGHLDWEAAGSVPRTPGRVSICMPTVEDWQRTRIAVDAVLAADDLSVAQGVPSDLEIVVLVSGSRRSIGAILGALYDAEPRVRITSMPRNLGSGIAASRAFLDSTGETVVFLDNDTEVLSGWLAPLVAALDDDGVLGAQPLLLRADGSIWSAGMGFLGGALLPSRLLDGHPVDDAVRLAPIRRTAVSGNALAMRAADVINLRGFDPAYVNGLQDVDLCLRAGLGAAGAFSVVTGSRVVHHCTEIRLERFRESDQVNRTTLLARWAEAMPEPDLGVLARLGLRIAHIDPGDPVEGAGQVRVPRPLVVRPGADVESGPALGQPCLRWAVKTGVPLRASSDEPDLVFASSLASSLAALGQDVVVDRLESNGRRSEYLDDVALAIRGTEALIEVPGQLNFLVRLDAGEPVTEEESRRYDAVFGSSEGSAVPDFDRLARTVLREAVAAGAKVPWALTD